MKSQMRRRNKEELNKFECEICNRTFKYRSLLLKHHLSHRQRPCSICNRKIRADRMERHMKTHDNEKERKFQCKICSVKFLKVTSLTRHLNHHKLKKNAGFKCQFCFKKFYLKAKLDRHLKFHAKFLRCDHCGFLFKRKQLLMAHMKKKHIAAEVCVVKCETCDKTFKSRGSLRQHQKTHQKAFECDVCGHKFATKAHLKDHLVYHFNPEAFKCDICLRIFTMEGNVRIHKIAVHQIVQQPRKFECQICHERYKTQTLLNRHQLVHQDRKTCGICQKSVAASSYRYHMKMHELKKQEKKFKCQVCRKKFLTKQLLIRHSKSHKKPFECDLCGHRVASKRNMKNHLKTHKG
jgi:KRAB domain-containing zinc finger protein